MIFQFTWEKVLRGEKTQTRRIRMRNEKGLVLGDGSFAEVYKVYEDGSTRTKWRRGQTYAVCPGRGKPQVGRIKIAAIRKERVQDITEEDAIAEGFKGLCGYGAYMEPIDHFFEAWEKIHGPGARERNDEVWVLEFERVTEAEPA